MCNNKLPAYLEIFSIASLVACISLTHWYFLFQIASHRREGKHVGCTVSGAAGSEDIKGTDMEIHLGYHQVVAAPRRIVWD